VDVLYYLNTQGGALNLLLKMWEFDPNDGTNIGPAQGTTLNTDAFLTGEIPLGDLRTGTDGLGFAGGKLWMCNQNQDKIARWNRVLRRADAVIDFGASPFFRECRDGLEGTDNGELGSGSIIWVAARENHTIVLVDVGTNADGPNAGATLQDRLEVLGEMDDPTFNGGAGTSNTGGLAILPQDPGNLRGAPFFNLYVGNINANLTDVVEAYDIVPHMVVPTGGGGDVIGGWQAPDFGISGYTANFEAPPEALKAAARPADITGGRRLAPK